MNRDTEIEVLKRLLHYVDTKSTALADAPWRNEVTAYTCPARHKREEEILFRKRPLLMGFSCDWPSPGSYRTEDYSGVPVLVARGKDGTLRAFINACRHRGAKVASGCGSAGTFTCPYHGWSYGNDGVLRGLPEESAFPGVRAERPGLTPLPLAEKYGMVWVLPTPAADGSSALDIEPWLAGLGPDLASWKLEGYHLFDRRVTHETMNWKILVDTFHESYHIGFLHKNSLGPILHTNVGDFAPFGPNFRLTFARTKLDRLRNTPESEWDFMWNTAIVYSMFANTLFVPQGDHMEVFRIFPLEGRPDRAVMETSLYIPRPIESEDERRHWQANMDLVIKVVTTEDFPAGRTMQIGFGSGAQSHIVYGRNEPALAHYHKSIRRAIGLPVEEGPTRVAAE